MNTRGRSWAMAAWMVAGALAAGGAFFAAPASAQVSDNPTGLVADPNGAAPEDWAIELTPEELEKLIRKADSIRLSDERQKVVDAIRSDLVYEDSSKDAAENLLSGATPNTQADNIDRILKAYARADTRFGKAYQLMQDGKYKECAEAAKQMLDESQTNYLSAAKYYLYADALAKAAVEAAKAGQIKAGSKAFLDAADAYLELVRLMPERISFAAAATLKAAKTFEDGARYINAMKVYAFALKNYGLTLTGDERDAILKKVEAWQDIFKDPMKYLSGEMGDVEKRLSSIDTGKSTQEKQQQIVRVLEDLIKTIEEAQQQGSSGSNPSNRDKKPGDKPGEQPGDKPGDKPGKGKSGKPSGTDQPSSPARDSFLPGGSTERPPKLGNVFTAKESDDWSKLPAEERQKLLEVMKNLVSERYRSLTGDYKTSISEAKDNPAK